MTVPPQLVDLLVLVGPSGGGKSSVARELHRRGVIDVWPTWTTRPPRADEQHGCLDHRFVCNRAFDEMQAQDFFIASGAHPGLPHRYGLAHPPTPPAPSLPALILRSGHVARVTSGRWPLIYQVVAPADQHVQRLMTRGCDRRELAARVAASRDEIDVGRRISTRHFVTAQPTARIADQIESALDIDRRITNQGGNS